MYVELIDLHTAGYPGYSIVFMAIELLTMRRMSEYTSNSCALGTVNLSEIDAMALSSTHSSRTGANQDRKARRRHDCLVGD